MVFNTLTVGAAVTPTVIETWFSHYTNRKPLHEKPTAHISYHVGLELVRQFIIYSSHHTVEDIQAFTAQWVPSPRWIRVENVTIPEAHLKDAAEYLQAQLGPKGIEAVGGSQWWQWRPERQPLKAEWLEMRKYFNARKHANTECKRSMLYVHGGAYYFGSVDEHRYQVQRHARKLQARVLSPRYRLAPQYPFPCGLFDCLAAYLYLLSVQPPETIILAGDSAGGAMIVSLLVILRDQNLPLPAGAILMSPWVDLTHSFPSVAGWNELDYVPAHGFAHRPSMAWPPPDEKSLKAMRLVSPDGQNAGIQNAGVDGSSDGPGLDGDGAVASFAPDLSITLDDKVVEIKDQIQMYTTNAMISHPLVSPVLQPSLGGLPPLLVLVGGGEMLRDEQIYLAHKAADPGKYRPSTACLVAQGPHAHEEVTKWPPTNVQLQVWEDLCHVAPTLSFTRPAKYMYRSVAQFGAWCLARAQKIEIELIDDEAISLISSRSSSSSAEAESPNHRRHVSNHSSGDSQHKQLNGKPRTNRTAAPPGHRLISSTSSTAIGTAGDPLPPFKDHMIRQRVTRHGVIFPLASAENLPACQMAPEDIGTIKPGPVRKWLTKQHDYHSRYAREQRAVEAQRIRETSKAAAERRADRGSAISPSVIPRNERPPPTSVALRVQLYGAGSVARANVRAGPQKKVGRFALRIWSGWGSKHDDHAVEKEEELLREERRQVRTANVVAQPVVSKAGEEPREAPGDATGRSLAPTTAQTRGQRSTSDLRSRSRSRSKSASRLSTRARRRSVMYEGQVEGESMTQSPPVPPIPQLQQEVTNLPHENDRVTPATPPLPVPFLAICPAKDLDTGPPTDAPAPTSTSITPDPPIPVIIQPADSSTHPITNPDHHFPIKLAPRLTALSSTAKASTTVLTGTEGIMPPSEDLSPDPVATSGKITIPLSTRSIKTSSSNSSSSSGEEEDGDGINEATTAHNISIITAQEENLDSPSPKRPRPQRYVTALEYNDRAAAANDSDSDDADNKVKIKNSKAEANTTIHNRATTTAGSRTATTTTNGTRKRPAAPERFVTALEMWDRVKRF